MTAEPFGSTTSHQRDCRIPSDLRGCHPLISQTKRVLEKKKPDEKSLLQSIENGILNVRVTRNTLHRALRIMQAIINASESRGWTVRPREEKSGCAIVIGEDDVGLNISEKINRFEIPPEKPTDGWYWKRYRYEATGLLTLEITEYLGDSMRRTWSDGKRQRLEDVLPDLMSGLATAAGAIRKRKLEWADRERQRRDNELRRQQLEQRVKVERQRRDQLFEQSNCYQQSAVLRKFITDFRAQKLPTFWTEEARARWLNWAERMEQRLDPFRNGYFSQELAESEFEPDLGVTEPTHPYLSLV